ncbi:MAG: protein kinase domain-containing protein [Planctomycetota bacterium]
MPAESWDNLKDIFSSVLERPPNERAAYLDKACHGDADLRAEVEAMVAAHEAPAPFLEPPARTASRPDDAVGVAGRRIGRYEIKRVVATGGMGTVYEAVQDHPHRLVALKVLRRGAASRQAMKRFQHEPEILGRLRHPNIAQVYDAGTYDEGEGGQLYFAMELVKGEPLVRYCKSKKLGTRQRLELFVKVCDAVQFAHHKGVIHRDLKPDNVLVDDFGEPKILDFGVARATDSDIQATTLQTDIGQLIGTVPYMSPEQVTGDPAELDTRSDVYSLGVVLYELLADRLPHDLRDKPIPEAVRIIGEQDPTPLSSISRIYRGDLDTITAKALEKDKDRRYQTAAELAADVRHYVKEEPIVARPASTFYQLGKFARRNKVLVGGIVAVFVVLVGGIIGIGLALAQARQDADRAELVSSFLEEILASPDPWEGKRELTAVQLLDEAAARIDSGFISHPDVAFRLHFTVARAYMKLGESKKARQHLETAVELGERFVGEEDPRTIEAIMWLADRNARSGRPDAVPLARRSLELCRRVHGPNSELTFEAIGLLGGALNFTQTEENLAEAEDILTDAIERAKRALAPEVPVTSVLHDILGTTYSNRYEFQEAERLMQTSLDWLREHSVPVDTAATMTLLAEVKGCAGDPKGGASLAREAYELRLESFGRQHTFTSGSLRALGWNLMWDGRLEEAEEAFAERLAIRQEKTGNENPAGAAFFVARVRLLQGKVSAEEALPFVERYVERNTDPIKLFHGEWGLTTKAYCLVRLGRFDEAREVMEQHPEEFIDALPPGHFERRLHFQTLAEMYEGLGQPQQATEYRALLREAEERRLGD